MTDLDIWLCAESYCGEGYGTAALVAPRPRLHKAYSVEEFVIRPSGRNHRAIAAYKRAVLDILSLSDAEQVKRFGEGDYEDAVAING